MTGNKEKAQESKQKETDGLDHAGNEELTK